MSKFIKKVYTVAAIASTCLISQYSFAQNSAAAQPRSNAKIVCADYKKGTTSIVGERAGKKIGKALEAYNNDLIDEAIAILEEIEAKQAFDRAFVNNFTGKMYAGQEGKGDKALELLQASVAEKVLNDNEHADTLRLVADLSMQEKKYVEAVKWYEQWMDFTCKKDPDVYTRMAQAFYESKDLAKMIDPADKAIALYDKPNKNPYVLKLTSYYERKLYKETVEVAEILVKTFPENKQWWTQLGFFYMLVEDYKRALATFEISYIKGYLTKKSELKALSQLYATNEIPYKAAIILEKYINEGLIERNDKTLSNLANSYHQAREYKKAAKYYGEAAKLNPDPDYYRKQGILLLAAEDYKGSLKALQAALDAGADQEGRIHIAMMEANLYSNNFRQAYVHVNEAKKHSNVARNARAWVPYIVEKAKNRDIKL